MFGIAKQKKMITVVLALALSAMMFSGIIAAEGTATSKIEASSATTTVGEEVTFTSTLFDQADGGTTPEGSVTFKDGDQVLSTVALSAAEPMIAAATTRVTPPSGGTTTGCMSACPIIQWGEYSYRAYSYWDNRLALNIVAYDSSGNMVRQWEKGGARYLSQITMDSAARTFTFWGQDNMTITIGWEELLSPSASASFKTSKLAIGTHSIAAVFSGDDNHPANSSVIPYTVHARYTATYDGNGSTGGDVPANSGSYKGTKVSVSGNDGNLARTGYTFGGWNTQADGQGTYYAPGAEGTISSDVKLYAKWTKLLNVGTGTASDPYQIASGEELDTIRNYLIPGLYFKLTADIDLSSYSQGWMPIGDSIQPFPGNIDGNGHRITGLTINRPNENYVGLFGYLSNNSSITDMKLENANVTGRQDVGGLVGRNFGGTISNSYASGSVTGKSSNVGGLIGYNYFSGTISNSFATGSVTGGGSSAGGLIGYNLGTISSSFATGNVVGSGSNAGGLIGNNVGMISSSYAAGDVTGNGSNAGGLTGANNGEIRTSYAAGAVAGNGSNAGGLTGINNGTVKDSFYDSDTTGQSDAGKGVGLTTEEMKTQSRYADSSWDFATVWGMSSSRHNGYPYLQAFQKFVAYDGNGNTDGIAPADSKWYSQGVTVNVYGQPVTLAKTHYTFAGWNAAADGSGKDYAAGSAFSMGSSDVILYAKWALNPTYTVTYDGNGSTGGSVPTDGGSYEQGVAASVYGNNGNLVKTGFTFAGWNAAADGTGTDYAAGADFILGSSDVILYAKWTLNPTYTVTYDGNGSTGGSVPADGGSYEQGAAVQVYGNNGNLVKTGFTFAGWNTAADGTGTDYAAGAALRMGMQPVTLYAQWLSANTLLSGLSVDQGTLDFSPSQTKYAVEVANSVTSVDLFLSKGDPAQALTVAGATYRSVTEHVYAYDASGLAVGPNPIGITVTAEDGANTAYVVTVIRKDVMGEPMKLDPSVRTLTFPGGLTIKLPDGLAIPEGATLTVRNSNAAPTDPVKLAKAGQVIDFQFAGLTIDQPVEITLGYDENSDRGKLAIFYYNERTGKWDYQPSRVSDNGIKASVSHFSIYGVLADTTAPDQVTVAAGAVTTGSITLHLSAHDDSGISSYRIFRDGTLIAETPESIYVDAGLAASRTYAYTVKAVDMLGNSSSGSESITVATSGVGGDTGTSTPPPSGGGSSTPPASDSKIISTNGRLTLPAGKAGEVSLGDDITIVIPADASGKDMVVTIEKVSDLQTLIGSKDVLLSPVFELLKNFKENFDKPVTLSFKFDASGLKGKEKPAVFYYDEAKREWVKVGGIVSGSTIAADVDHFTKYAVFAAADAAPPATDGSATKAGFSDIGAHWAEAGIKQAVSAGIVSGYPDGTFKPGRTVTRAEFAVMLMNALKPQGDGAAPLAFADKAKIGSWAQKSIMQAVQAGVVNGYEDGTFRPNAEITRAEMAVAIAKALGQTDEAAAASGFADDKDIPDWAKGAVAEMKQRGMIKGKGANEFVPGGKATRAEAVTMLLNMLAQMSK
ncbi:MULTISPECIES: InlB B-repeat-containing protein [unclassified Paenibacillus]|uniref:InlB B-repeat-containing protein n=1 Tax=unclassified Paenibacillus TaxID=185978 RepID=UPI001F12267E|nr:MULTISPECIES: InlB B-repeat-containing protein [unclassified Paenibacillus]